MHYHVTPRFDSPYRRARRTAFGLSVVGVGTLALIDNLHWFETPLLHTFWPLAFVLWGLARLVWPGHAAKRAFGIVLIAVGGLMTSHNLGYHTLEFRQWWPVLVILAGISIVLRGMYRNEWRHKAWAASSTIEHVDAVSADAMFSAMKLQNDSRSFKGGRIAVTFGGLELDLRDAVMDGPEVTLTINNTFGGVELKVPRAWQVVVQINATMGAVHDKTAPPLTPEHRLIVRGDAVFGNIEIKN